MLASLGNAAVMMQSGAAFLQVVTPMTADRAIWLVPAGSVEMRQVWSDRAYQFNFVAPLKVELAISEGQSKSLHEALIASFDEFIAPILIS